MSRCVAFDLSRLFTGPMMLKPRGIDRVDLAYAKHFLQNWHGDCVGTLPTPWGTRWFKRDRSLLVVNFIEAYWGEIADALSDPAYAWVKARLRGEKPPLPMKKSSNSPAYRLSSGFLDFLRQHGIVLGSRIGSLARGAVYLNTGHYVLGAPWLLSWLARRRDVKPVFMIHDVIPLEFPEYCWPATTYFHEKMLVSTTRFAAGLIVTTEAAKKSITRELTRLHRPELPTLVAPLAVSPPFLEPAEPDLELRDISYFVIAGTIEPRKNHQLLLDIWQELVRRHGTSTPKLLVIGSRTGLSKEVLDLLDRDPLIRDHVIQVAGLSSPGLRRLLAGARALLMPSFAEGFGLPIIEALTLGTPVIASDLDCHKEVGGAYAQYLSPIDGPGWLAAIEAYMKGEVAQSQREQLRSYQPQTWKSYFEKIEPFLLSR